MGILFKKKSYITAAVAAIVASLLMVIFSDIAVLSAKKGIELWISSVLPAMLPFFICVNFMTGIGLIELLPVNVFPFAMSALSGYPMGAKVIGDMCRRGLIDLQETKRLVSFCSTSGPVFMIGAVGVGMLGSQTAGLVIAVSHYAGALINGVIYSFVFSGGKVNRQQESRIEENDLLETLTGSIFAAFRSMAVILAYIIFFMFIMDIINMTGIFDLIDSDMLVCLMKGFVEMTVGCSSLSEKAFTLLQGSVSASVIISWGGLSIIGQSMSMLTGTGLSLKYIAFTKLTHSIFAGIIALFIGSLML